MGYLGGHRGGGLAAAAAAIALLAFPVTASASVLFDGIDSTPPGFITSQDFETVFDNFDSTTADDFQVPAGQVWQPSAVRAPGFKIGTTAPTAVNVKFYANSGTLPGAEFYSTAAQAAAGTAYPDFNLPIKAAPVLGPGTYWLSIQARLDGVAFANPQQWFWRESSEGAGSPPAFKNPGDGFGASCLVFTVKSSCPLPNVPPPGSSPHTAPGQSFAIDGSSTAAKFVVSKARPKSHGRLALTVNAPNIGKLVAKSRQMKGATKTLTKVGGVQLTMKPTPKTKAALADGRSVVAGVKLNLPRIGGGSLKVSTSTKLKP